MLLVRFLLSSPPRVGRLHADPHPGNVRLLDDGRLAVVDFGSTVARPTGRPPRLGALLRAGRDRDADRLLDVAASVGIVRDRGVSREALLDLMDPVVEPLRQEQFTFTRDWIRGLTTGFSDLRSTVSHAQRRLTFRCATCSSTASELRRDEERHCKPTRSGSDAPGRFERAWDCVRCGEMTFLFLPPEQRSRTLSSSGPSRWTP